MSIALAQFLKLAVAPVIGAMQTVAETRLTRLNMLIKQHGGLIAALNVAIGLDRTDATLSQIRTQARHSRTGKPRAMGDELARKIEARLGLEHGWMDTPPTYAELHGAPDDPRSKVLALMESMPPSEWPKIVRLIDALAQPEPGNGTTGQQ